MCVFKTHLSSVDDTDSLDLMVLLGKPEHCFLFPLV